MANRHLSYEEFKNIFGDLGVTEWTKYNWLDNNFNLPSNLVRVEYIESTGIEYIDTGIYLDYSKSFSLQMKAAVDNSAERGAFFSNFRSDTGIAIWTEIGTNSYLRFGWGGTGAADIFGSHLVQPEVINEIEFRHDNDGLSYILLNGVADGSAVDDRTTTATDSLLLFKDYRGRIFYRVIKCYEAKIFVDGELVRSYIPVFDADTGKYGLYDLVGQQFYGNDGTGDFTGPKVFAFTPENESNINYYGDYYGLKTFYIDIGAADWVQSFETAATNNDYSLVESVGNFGYRPQQLSDDWNINRCYVFFVADSQEEAKEMLKNNPVVVYIK